MDESYPHNGSSTSTSTSRTRTWYHDDNNNNNNKQNEIPLVWNVTRLIPCEVEPPHDNEGDEDNDNTTENVTTHEIISIPNWEQESLI